MLEVIEGQYVAINAEEDLLSDTLQEVKDQLHRLNNALYPVPEPKKAKIAVQNLSLSLKYFREERAYTPDKMYYAYTEKVAGQCGRMLKQFEEYRILGAGAFNAKQSVTEYLILRKFVLRLEKAMVKELYFQRKKTVTRTVLSIQEAAKERGRNELTVRRQIRSNKIMAFQLAKAWWIPIEEVRKIKRGKVPC